MLYQASKLRGYTLGAIDGEIGSVEDIYFDDEWWTVRYFVVSTGKWLKGRQVLISPIAVRGDWHEHAIPVDLTREQVEKSPPVASDKPVSKRYEEILAAHYRYPYYWSGPHRWGIAAYPPVPAMEASVAPLVENRELQAMVDAEKAAAETSRLRSCVEVMGYGVEAMDGGIGFIDDFLIDSETWAIPHLIVDKSSWLPGGKVLVSPETVTYFDWHSRTADLKLTRDDIKRSPEYP